MADNHAKEVRSRNMSHIHSKNTKALAAMGWNVLVVWERQPKKPVFDSTVKRLAEKY